MTPPLPFLTPADLVLRAIKRTLDDYDWQADGVPKVTIRHARRRYSTPPELPCVTIRWEQDEPRAADQEQRYLSAEEMAVEMRITLEVEIETPEADDEDDEVDPTGLGWPSALAAIALRALKDPEGELMRLWASGVSDRGRGEDPASEPDIVRFEQGAIVLYRVLREDPAVILAEGVNA